MSMALCDERPYPYIVEYSIYLPNYDSFYSSTSALAE